jgi:hypothetical protein
MRFLISGNPCDNTCKRRSKGIPGKNIKELAGKTLIAYTIEASLKVKIHYQNDFFQQKMKESKILL